MKNIKFSKSNHLGKHLNISLASQTFSKSAMNFVKGATPLFIDKGRVLTHGTLIIINLLTIYLACFQ